MACRQCHRIVEKEERGPVMGRGERGSPIPVDQLAGDPEVAGMVTDDLFVRIDQAPAVSREHSPPGHGMEVSEWVDTITAGHLGSVAYQGTPWSDRLATRPGRTVVRFVASLCDSSAR